MRKKLRPTGKNMSIIKIERIITNVCINGINTQRSTSYKNCMTRVIVHTQHITIIIVINIMC